MPVPAPSKLTWANDTELVGLQLELEPSQTTRLYQRYMVGLHAWFLEQVETLNPKLSEYLHDGGAEKPFVLSNLEGDFVQDRDQIQIQSGQPYYWSIYALSQPVVQWLATWLTQRPDYLEFRDTSLTIKQVRFCQQPTTYKKLLRSRKSTSEIIHLNFLSPTSFHSKGHHLPLPLPRLVFQSYLRRWNDFSNLPYEVEPFLEWIEENVSIYDYQLAASKVAIAKQGFVTGFTGKLTYELKRTVSADLEAVRLFHTLLRLAPYCGTGHKTTFGLGRTELEFPADPSRSPITPQLLTTQPKQPEPVSAITDPTPSIQDIDALTQHFLAQRKRQGGTRAIAAARTAAEIVVRHETGESLKAIAQKMGKPYDAIKKAYTRAKQSLQGNTLFD